MLAHGYSEFLGAVQQRARLDSQEAAVGATRATLATLSERLDPGEAGDVAAQLPGEIGRYLTEVEGVESFPWREFVDRVAEREGLDEGDRADATYHAQVVLAVVAEAVTPGELADLRDQLPEGYDDLFELAEREGSP